MTLVAPKNGSTGYKFDVTGLDCASFTRHSNPSLGEGISDFCIRRRPSPRWWKTAITFNSSLRRAAFVALFAIFSDTAVQAHAHLVKAVPAADSNVNASPRQVELSFSEALEPAFSTIEVLDEKYWHVGQGKAELDSGNAKVLTVPLLPLLPGAYKVVWRVVSVDAHELTGEFTFWVAP